jgi:glutathione S-transferase
MACREKGVAYTLSPARPHSPEVDEIHPFGKIPVMRHGEIALCESKAICTYIDLGFNGPPLIPRDPHGAAVTEQWISLFNAEIAPLITRQYLQAYFFSGLPDGAPDRNRIDAALPEMQKIVALLDRELAARSYLAGASVTLADAYLFPLVHYMRKLPESTDMLQKAPALTAWFERIAARPSARETDPPPMPSSRS